MPRTTRFAALAAALSAASFSSARPSTIAASLPVTALPKAAVTQRRSDLVPSDLVPVTNPETSPSPKSTFLNPPSPSQEANSPKFDLNSIAIITGAATFFTTALTLLCMIRRAENFRSRQQERNNIELGVVVNTDFQQDTRDTLDTLDTQVLRGLPVGERPIVVADLVMQQPLPDPAPSAPSLEQSSTASSPPSSSSSSPPSSPPPPSLPPSPTPATLLHTNVPPGPPPQYL